MARRVENSTESGSRLLPIGSHWWWPGLKFNRQGGANFGKQLKQLKLLETNTTFISVRQCILTLIGEHKTGRADAAASLYLTHLAQAVVVGARPTRATYNRSWAEGTGMSWKSLKQFPEQIESMASKIERLNAAPFFASEFSIEPCLSGFIEQPHAILSASMSLYAKALKTRLQTTRSYARPILSLTYFVKEWTGKYHDRQVAELLNAAAAALQIGRSYEPPDLAQARSRYKKTRPT